MKVSEVTVRVHCLGHLVLVQQHETNKKHYNIVNHVLILYFINFFPSTLQLHLSYNVFSFFFFLHCNFLQITTQKICTEKSDKKIHITNYCYI